MKWLIVLAAALAPVTASAQTHEHGTQRAWSLGVGAQAIPLLTHATPADRGRDLTEGYLSQPNLFLHAHWARLGAQATINFEGLTLQRGELNAGTWGEGFIDRRHPHTYLHEALLTVDGSLAGQAWSVAGGKGFAPFGTDDPMARPFLKFPANHHLTQVLERLVAIGALEVGPVILEAGLLNGDEPLRPESLGTLDRFGDSWAARITLRPRAGYELQASHANLESPEQPAGHALDQRKWDVSVRYQQEAAQGGRYLLVEWARTTKRSDELEVVALHSLLAEASVHRRDWRVGLRAERTVRPEEERTGGSVFRSPWPHADERIWGLTRWLIATGNVSRQFEWAGLRWAPVLEVTRQWAKPTVSPAIFSPELLFGSNRLWSLTLGVRLAAGMPHLRMGRYGVAQ
ncbi:MAG: hypothetical protein ACRENP_11225 [Longimicrobiales bacterium]